jgi:hypothetical protein
MEELQKVFYSNSISVFAGTSDFVLKFQTNVPKMDKNNEITVDTKNEVNVIISPVVFKKLTKVMENRLNIFESTNGEILIKDKKIKRKSKK